MSDKVTTFALQSAALCGTRCMARCVAEIFYRLSQGVVSGRGSGGATLYSVLA